MFKTLVIAFFVFIGIQAFSQIKLEFNNVDSLINWIENQYYNPNNDIRNSNFKDVIKKKYLDLKSSEHEIEEINNNEEVNYEVREIFKLSSASLNLIVPVVFPTEIRDGEYSFDCEKHQSFLKFETESTKKSIKIKLNPYCSQSYCIDEIDVVLFKTDYIIYPVVVIVSNDPAYVPADIYFYSEKDNSYKYLKTLPLY